MMMLLLKHSRSQKCKNISCPHGGGNINLLAMDEGTSFVEIILMAKYMF